MSTIQAHFGKRYPSLLLELCHIIGTAFEPREGDERDLIVVELGDELVSLRKLESEINSPITSIFVSPFDYKLRVSFENQERMDFISVRWRFRLPANQVKVLPDHADEKDGWEFLSDLFLHAENLFSPAYVDATVQVVGDGVLSFTVMNLDSDGYVEHYFDGKHWHFLSDADEDTPKIWHGAMATPPYVSFQF